MRQRPSDSERVVRKVCHLRERRACSSTSFPAAGSGLPEAFLQLLKRALSHYDYEVSGLVHSDALERSVLRLFASQLQPEFRWRLMAAVLRRLRAKGVTLGDSITTGARELIAERLGAEAASFADLEERIRETADSVQNYFHTMIEVPAGIGPDGDVLGSLRPTGVRPKFAEQLKLSGIELPYNIFEIPEK